jgi:hypothetical protein
MHKKILHPAAPDFQLKRKKRERRKKKEERWRKGSRHLAGRGSEIVFFLFSCFSGCGSHRPTVCFFFSCFSGCGSRRPTVFFFLPDHGSRSTSPSSSLAVALPRHLTVTHLATSRQPVTETHGWVSPAVGLVFS